MSFQTKCLGKAFQSIKSEVGTPSRFNFLVMFILKPRRFGQALLRQFMTVPQQKKIRH